MVVIYILVAVVAFVVAIILAATGKWQMLAVLAALDVVSLIGFFILLKGDTNYCPNCGAKLGPKTIDRDRLFHRECQNPNCGTQVIGRKAPNQR
ncbi:MAG: hypothetical protein WC519_01405 [Parcubacteria group bacterium]